MPFTQDNLSMEHPTDPTHPLKAPKNAVHCHPSKGVKEESTPRHGKASKEETK